MKTPEEPPPAPLPRPMPLPLPAPDVHLPMPGIPLPPLDESHWRFVFQRAAPEDDEEN